MPDPVGVPVRRNPDDDCEGVPVEMAGDVITDLGDIEWVIASVVVVVSESEGELLFLAECGVCGEDGMIKRLSQWGRAEQCRHRCCCFVDA